MREVRGGSKSSTNKKDIKDMSDELIVRWNGPHTSKCDSVVVQALNLHFKSGPWHFISHDVKSKMHRVSLVIDRNNPTPLALTFSTAILKINKAKQHLPCNRIPSDSFEEVAPYATWPFNFRSAVRVNFT